MRMAVLSPFPFPYPLSGSFVMKSALNAVKRFIKNEDGPTAVEYAVMLALIIVLCIVVIRNVGTSASATFSATDSAIS